MDCLVDDAIFIGKSDNGSGANQYLPLKWGNRHGLVAGATVALQVLAEGFATAGVMVFLAKVLVRGILRALKR